MSTEDHLGRLLFEASISASQWEDQSSYSKHHWAITADRFVRAYKAEMRKVVPAEVESGFAPFSDGEEQAYRLGAKDMHRLILGEDN